ncbi:unnamed protein product [Brugia timori]|uniref:Uncharacterized protein n=1 Tax=Brugia timori TaxID=42155 RepID=A0A0R3QHN6_9BILA|nr:unnamed protein product [Brugia timori]
MSNLSSLHSPCITFTTPSYHTCPRHIKLPALFSFLFFLSSSPTNDLNNK